MIRYAADQFNLRRSRRIRNLASTGEERRVLPAFIASMPGRAARPGAPARIVDLPKLAGYSARMKFRSVPWLLILLCLLAFPFQSPAPLIYRPGEK